MGGFSWGLGLTEYLKLFRATPVTRFSMTRPNVLGMNASKEMKYIVHADIMVSFD
jgi:hypothetical protein